ncbi:hypothetical protein ACWEOE_14885 [Amycolatopsis sp. NPDC004368]
MAQAIAVRSAAHAFEGKLFSVVACSTITDEMIEIAAGDDPEIARLMRRPNSALSGIFGPDGNPVVAPLVGEEGIVHAEIDLARSSQPKQLHDIVGGYNRFDVFQLQHDMTPRRPVVFEDRAAGAGAIGSPQPVVGPWRSDEDETHGV